MGGELQTYAFKFFLFFAGLSCVTLFITVILYLVWLYFKILIKQHRIFIKSNNRYLIELWELTGLIDKSCRTDDCLFIRGLLRWPKLFGPDVHCCFVVFFLSFRFFVIYLTQNLIVEIIWSFFVSFLAWDLFQLFDPEVSLICNILTVS